jgi:hypothetical protein
MRNIKSYFAGKNGAFFCVFSLFIIALLFSAAWLKRRSRQGEQKSFRSPAKQFACFIMKFLAEAAGWRGLRQGMDVTPEEAVSHRSYIEYFMLVLLRCQGLFW